MLGWKVLRHSISMIFGNIGPALRISLVPMFLYLSVEYLLLDGYVGRSENDLVSILVIFLVALPIMMAVGAWLAVGWHRFILLGESPGAVTPSVHLPESGRYILRVVYLVLAVVLLAAIVGSMAGIVAGIFGTIFGADSVRWGGTAGGVTGVAAGIWANFRFGLTLPAAAIGRPMTFRESWSNTKGLTRLFLLLIFVYWAIQFTFGWVLDLTAAAGVKLIGEAVINWSTTMLSIGILTTLYGVLVEKRSID